jgi:hypothetical protein
MNVVKKKKKRRVETKKKHQKTEMVWTNKMKPGVL